MSKILVAINYSGLQLQVVKNASDEDVIAVKPLSDLVGLQWKGQYEKITKREFYCKFLGVCTVPMYHKSGQIREQTSILISRVDAFLMSINPVFVRNHGNENAAEFLEQKRKEWADALHDFKQRTSFV